MTIYTPITDEVRASYVLGEHQINASFSVAETEQCFDSWRESEHHDTAQAVAVEREAIAGWLIRNAHSEDMWAIDDMLTAIAKAIRSGEHVKP